MIPLFRCSLDAIHVDSGFGGEVEAFDGDVSSCGGHLLLWKRADDGGDNYIQQLLLSFNPLSRPRLSPSSLSLVSLPLPSPRPLPHTYMDCSVLE